MERHEHVPGTIEDLWALVQEQRARIEQLEAKGRRRAWGGVTRTVSIALSIGLIAVMGGITYAAGAGPLHDTAHGQRFHTNVVDPPAWFVRSTGGRWQAQNIQESDLPNLNDTYVDLSADQTVFGTKTFSLAVDANGGITFSDATTQTTAATRTIGGVVNANGTVQYATSGITVTHDGTGKYTITAPAGSIRDGNKWLIPLINPLAGAYVYNTNEGHTSGGGESISIELRTNGVDTDDIFNFALIPA
jgi:hypothetical protein